MAIKLTPRQISIGYFGKVAQEWQAKWGRPAAERMILEACEYTECLKISDRFTIWEVADGKRVA